MEEFISQRAAKHFDDQNTWNVVCKKINDNGSKVPTNQTEMNRHIKQIEAHLDAIKSHITHLYERAAESEDNYVDPYDTTKGSD